MNRPAFGVELLIIQFVFQAIPPAMDQMGQQDYPTTADALQLKDWGDKIIPMGNHRGKTFKDLYDDQKTCKQYRNRAASAPWVVSLVAFIHASDKKKSEEAEWEVLHHGEGEKGAMDPPAKQPEPCQTISLTVPAGSHVSIVVTKNTSAGQK